MTENPLSKYFRKPAIYVSLPSKGNFNPEIEQTMIEEVGVLPMTAIDEIGMRSPDALLNGEALISLIKSCVPSIPNPRNLCNIDVEALYLAIQYATYGKDITHTHKCSKCGTKSDFNIDINFLLNKFPEIDKVEPILYEDLVIHLTQVFNFTDDECSQLIHQYPILSASTTMPLPRLLLLTV